MMEYSPFRIWDKCKDKMIYQDKFNLLALQGNSYWKVKVGFDNVKLMETNQNCATPLFNTNVLQYNYKPIYEYDIVRRDWYSFKDNIVFDQQYGIIFNKQNWRIKLENGIELNLSQKEEGLDYRVRIYVVGNYFEGYLKQNIVPAKYIDWDYESPPLLFKNILENTP